MQQPAGKKDKDKWFLRRFLTAKVLQRQDWINYCYPLTVFLFSTQLLNAELLC